MTNTASFPSVVAAYDARIAAGEITGDPAQEAVAHRLDDLSAALAATSQRASLLRRLVGGRDGSRRTPAGLYIWGDVGRGKTMLMDMFFAVVPVRRKRRAHFNDFMGEVHALLRREREDAESGGDHLPAAARALAENVRLLCFDEFMVTDIADAMILGRLFTQLFENGVTLVATSNVAPDELYAGGLNRQHIVPFIRLLKQKVDVLKLDAAGDYRLDKLQGHRVYFVAAEPDAHAALDRLWRRLLGGRTAAPGEIEVGGRKLPVAAMCGALARFDFDGLCRRPRGAADYLAIARRFHTVVIDAVPVMSAQTRNETRRFITLVDIFYDNRVRLVLEAAAEPDGLFVGTDGAEAFEFRRTASRLHEMRSDSYLHDVEEMPMT